jgi:hypothetical protein
MNQNGNAQGSTALLRCIIFSGRMSESGQKRRTRSPSHVCFRRVRTSRATKSGPEITGEPS